jgi:hypothetical protein
MEPRSRLGRIDIRENANELISSVTQGDVVCSKSLSNLSSDSTKQMVTCGVTRGVVQRLKPVDINKHQREALPESA